MAAAKVIALLPSHKIPVEDSGKAVLEGALSLPASTPVLVDTGCSGVPSLLDPAHPFERSKAEIAMLQRISSRII